MKANISISEAKRGGWQVYENYLGSERKEVYWLFSLYPSAHRDVEVGDHVCDLSASTDFQARMESVRMSQIETMTEVQCKKSQQVGCYQCWTYASMS